ncbi:response regulator [Desulfonatronovibrio hydrogenovorans]|uniref:response regulator n=1 Tax=Desulfonatronovibrio hydrogenovorans TaxID=53245 RepID=UPI00048C3E68|nr:response regulator [Desulfonatronovibrio hydrogenovorans]
MPVITIFSAPYCREEEVATNLAGELRMKILRDRQIISRAASRYNISEDKFYRSLYGKSSVFNAFTREKERCIACYKAVLASCLLEEDLVAMGFGGFLIPKKITHVLKVCLMADMEYRLEVAGQEHSLDSGGLKKLIAQEDASRYRWTEYVVHQGPWQSSLYDILISMEKYTIPEVSRLIRSYAKKAATLPTRESIQAAENFALSAEIEAGMALKGWFVRVNIGDGKLQVRLDKNILRPERLEKEISGIVADIAGDMEIEVQSGPDMFQTDVYRPFESESPARVLLVDDEQRFARTLSERLRMREMGTAVVYDGEEALELIDQDEPQVVILDLKMPEIDGVQVLRHIRRSHPKVQVIILSGAGYDEDLQTCLDLGAFACLQKPVDIRELTEAIRKAYEKRSSQIA